MTKMDARKNQWTLLTDLGSKEKHGRQWAPGPSQPGLLWKWCQRAGCGRLQKELPREERNAALTLNTRVLQKKLCRNGMKSMSLFSVQVNRDPCSFFIKHILHIQGGKTCIFNSIFSQILWSPLVCWEWGIQTANRPRGAPTRVTLEPRRGCDWAFRLGCHAQIAPKHMVT